MKWVSLVGNKGLTKPEFLISNFTLFKGNRVQVRFKLLGGQKKKILAMNPYNPFVYIMLLATPWVCMGCELY
jgi:hypothetical protein